MFTDVQKFANMNASQVFRRRLSSKREKGVHGFRRSGRTLCFHATADPNRVSNGSIEGDIKDRGNGDYEIIYISKTAGPVEVVVTGNSEEAVTYSTHCQASHGSRT